MVLKELPEGTKLIQYVRENGQPGMYSALPGTTPEQLAILSEGRKIQSFVLTKPLQVVESTAAEFLIGKVPGVGGPGGGQQLILPAGWQSAVK